VSVLPVVRSVALSVGARAAVTRSIGMWRLKRRGKRLLKGTPRPSRKRRSSQKPPQFIAKAALANVPAAARATASASNSASYAQTSANATGARTARARTTAPKNNRRTSNQCASEQNADSVLKATTAVPKSGKKLPFLEYTVPLN